MAHPQQSTQAHSPGSAAPGPAAPTTATAGGLSTAQASVIGAVLVFVGGLIGAFVGGYFDLSKTELEGERSRIIADIENAGDRELEKLKSDGLINIEKFKLQRDLVLKAIDKPSPKEVRDTLQFFIRTGLIPDFAQGVETYLKDVPDEELPFDRVLGNLKKEDYRMRVEQFRFLLDLIGRAESLGNYNAYIGAPSNQAEPRFTDMTITEVRQWQDAHVAAGSKSSGVGKYLLIRKTIDSLSFELGITGAELFSAEHQDMLATRLLERRGIARYLSGSISREDFALRLAMEWATVPVLADMKIGSRPVKAGQSYYAGDGVNRANIRPEELIAALDAILPGEAAAAAVSAPVQSP